MKELREKIYNEQFWQYGKDCQSANEVLKAIETISTNPMLLEYVLKCLFAADIDVREYWYIVAHKDNGKRVQDEIIPKLFVSKMEAFEYTLRGDMPHHLMYERCSIRSINPQPNPA